MPGLTLAQPPIDRGFIGVDRFSALSGFILADRQAGTLNTGVTSRDYFSFLRAWLARIYPVHPFTRARFGYGATFNAPSWSISAEWFASLPSPLLLLGLARLRTLPAFVLVAVGALLLTFAYYATWRVFRVMGENGAGSGIVAAYALYLIAVGAGAALLWLTGRR